MPSLDSTRRRLLAGAAAGAAGALAGCPAHGGPRYSLRSRPDEGADPVDLFTWRPASNAFHYEREDAEAMAADLRETGTVESVEIPLVEPRPSGESGFRPAYVERDDDFHRVRVAAEPVALERWVVWAEPLEELPDGVDPETDPMAGRSELDARVLDRAIDEAYVSVLEDRDHGAQPATDRGVVFFAPLDPADSDLVPEPPFEYARVDVDSEFDPDELAFRLRVGRETVETTRYTHDLEAVADDRSGFVTHVDAEHVAAEFERSSLSEAERTVLEGSTELTGYDEEGTPLAGFESVLAALDLEDVSLPDDREVASWLRFYAYDGAYYRARFRISDTSLVDVELG